MLVGMTFDGFSGDGSNRDKAADGDIVTVCERLLANETLNSAFKNVGTSGYFEMADYLKIHDIITIYWQETGGDIYLGDLLIAEAVCRRVVAGEFSAIDSDETKAFIKKHRPHRHADGSLIHPGPATVDDVIELIKDLRSLDNIKEICVEAADAFQSGDRNRIEEIQSQEFYLAERYRRKKGYMEKVGYQEAFTVLSDLLSGEYKQELNSKRMRKRIKQGLGFWDY